jgi:RNA polymerase sigma-70 factor (ECF subfamily)
MIPDKSADSREWFGALEVSRSSKEGPLGLEDLVAGYFETLRDSVYSYLVVAFRRPSDAEEATQEAFFRLYQTLHAGHSVRNVKGWLLRVAHNCSVKLYEQRGRESVLDLATLEEDALARLVANREEEPDKLLLCQERWGRLNAAWMTLTPQQKRCMKLRLAGLRYREIGQVLGVSAPAVKQALGRAIATLMRETRG